MISKSHASISFYFFAKKIRVLKTEMGLIETKSHQDYGIGYPIWVGIAPPLCV